MCVCVCVCGDTHGPERGEVDLGAAEVVIGGDGVVIPEIELESRVGPTESIRETHAHAHDTLAHMHACKARTHTHHTHTRAHTHTHAHLDFHTHTQHADFDARKVVERVV